MTAAPGAAAAPPLAAMARSPPVMTEPGSGTGDCGGREVVPVDAAAEQVVGVPEVELADVT